MGRFSLRTTTRRARIAGLAVIALLAVSAAATTAFAASAGAPIPSGNWVFDYEHVTPADIPLFQGARGVVVVAQNNREATVETIHAAGAKAFGYVGVYWYPIGRTYNGVDISEHPDWQFCQSGSRPMARFVQDDVPRAYLDLNERGLYDSVISYLQELKAAGFDGVFMDRGTVAMAAGALPHEVSTCTTDPVVKGATFADAYARVVKAAHAMGLRVVLNYGSSVPLRSDLRPVVDRILQETAPHTTPETLPASNKRRAAEERAARGGASLYIEELKTAEPNDRHGAYYEWAEGALWRIDLAINAGDDNCVGVQPGVICWHYGTFPELTRTTRGAAMDAAPIHRYCQSGSTSRCLWVRHWQQEIVAVNETNHPITTTFSTRHTTGRKITDLWARRQLAGGKLVKSFRVTIPALSGRLYAESAAAPRS